MECIEVKEYLQIILEDIEQSRNIFTHFAQSSSKDSADQNTKLNIEFITRGLSIQNWLSRCPFSFQYKFFQLLFLSSKKSVLVRFYNTFYTAICKESVYHNLYEDADNQVVNPYINKKILENVMCNDLKWYADLHAGDQFICTLGFAKVCSLYLKSEILHFISNILNAYEESKNVSEMVINLNVKSEIIKRTSVVKEDQIDEEDEDQQLRKKLQSLYEENFTNIKLDNSIYNRYLREWENIFGSYKEKFAIKKPKKEDGKKGSKKKKPKKKPKKAKKDKKAKNALDYVQLLPVWLNKTIFAQLEGKGKKKKDKKSKKDKKGLKINKYWKFLLTNAKKDKSGRQRIDKLIKKTKRKVNKDVKKREEELREQEQKEKEQREEKQKEEEYMKELEMCQRKESNIKIRKRRKRKPKIITNTYKESSLLANIFKQDPQLLFFPAEDYQNFPRII